MLKFGFKGKLIMAIFLGVLLTSLWSKSIYLLVLFSLTTYIVLPIKKYWDGTCIMLVLFSIIYSIMTILTSQYGSGFLLISYLISPVAFYRFGRWTMSNFYDEKVRQKLLFYIITCYLLSLFIMTFKDIALVGIVNVSRVLLGDLNGGDGLAATLYGLMASVGLGCITVLFTKQHNIWLFLGYILLSILSVLVVVHLVNRTGLVIVLSCLLVAFVLSGKMRINKFLPALLLISILTLVVVRAGLISDEIVDAYIQRETSSTYDLTQLGGRSDIWADAVKNLVYHPLGWDRVYYAHNMWLDIARVGGWFSLLFFLIATFNWCKNCFRLIRKPMTTFRLMVISINVAMFLASFVEPVIEGSILYFSLYMMIWGYTKSLSMESTI